MKRNLQRKDSAEMGGKALIHRRIYSIPLSSSAPLRGVCVLATCEYAMWTMEEILKGGMRKHLLSWHNYVALALN
jgi:hypothetical protein